MAETLDALAAAHGRGVLHRDIKPSNILLEQDGHTKITDFGIAKSFDVRARPTPLPDDATMTGVVLGTPGYLAPERRSGQLATVQSDLYAVGAVMVEALTGKRLGPDPVPTGSIPLPLRDVARRAMATDPRRRFSSANEMFQALRVAAGDASQTMRPSRAQLTAPHTAATTRTATQGTAMLGAARPAHDRPARTRRRMLALATVAVLALAGGVFFVLSNGTEPTAPAVTHHVRTQALARKAPKETDSEGAALTAAAATLADGGLPGDGPLASALQETAAQPQGAPRQAAAQQALSLAGVLLDGGGITSAQYQDVVSVLQAAGATVPTTTTTTTTTTTLVTMPPKLERTPFFPGHGHGHDGGYGAGDQG